VCLDDSIGLGGIEGRDLHQSKNASMTWNDTSCPQHSCHATERAIELTRRRKNSIYSYKRRKPLPRVKENKRCCIHSSLNPRRAPMGPEPLPRGQYPVSILFVIIQADGAKFIKGMERCTSPFSQWRSQAGSHPYRINRSIERVGSTMRAGSLNPRECVSEGVWIRSS